MNDAKENDLMARAEQLLQLRQAIRRSRQLATALTIDPVIGEQAQKLLQRLDVIQVELDKLRALLPTTRPAQNDSMWPSPVAFRQ